MSSCSSDSSDDESNVRQALYDWVKEETPTVSSVNNLLKKLQKIHVSLPKDYRTLMKTPQNLIIHQVNPGNYHHFGVKSKLKNLWLLSIF